MSASAPRRPSRTQRMDRIAEAFRLGVAAAARPDAGAAASPVRAAAAKRQPESGGPLPAWIGMTRDSREQGDRAPSDFSHLHRSLAAGEPIPQAPGLLEQIRGLSRLLARHPLSRQEEEALRGEDEPGRTGAAPEADTADAEDEAFA